MRLSALLLVVLFSLALAPTAIAGKAGGAKHHQTGEGPRPSNPEHQPPDGENRPEATRPDDELKPGPGPNPRERRRCRHRARPGVPGDCFDDDHYDDDQARPSLQPSDAPKAAPEGSAAKIDTLPRPDGKSESFTPHADDALKEKMISARKRWLAKKSEFDEASAARARAEYQAQQSGGSVDPALITRQKQAQAEADAARAEMAPLADQAREAGMSPNVVELYEKSDGPN